MIQDVVKVISLLSATSTIVSEEVLLTHVLRIIHGRFGVAGRVVSMTRFLYVARFLVVGKVRIDLLMPSYMYEFSVKTRAFTSRSGEVSQSFIV